MKSLLYRALAAAVVLVLASTGPASAQPLQVGTPEPLPVEGFFAPSWSPDGSRIALTKARYEGIYVVDVASGRVDTLTAEAAAGFDFSWSPDGSSIAARVARFEDGNRSDAIKVFDVNTRASAQLTEYRVDMAGLPRWQGGSVIVYANGELEVLPTQSAKASDAKPVLVRGETGLARVAMGKVEHMDAFADRPLLSVTPSPDGSKVAFEVLGGHLHVMNADGSGLVDLGVGHKPSWSPDGEWVVFMRTEDDGHAITASDLYAARTDGSATVRLTDTLLALEMNPSWSPDGARIAYDDLAEGRIYLLPIFR